MKIKGDKGAVAPSKETILSGEYPALARPLYLYVKNDSLKRAEVKAFLGYYLENVVTHSEKAGYVGPTADEIKANSGAFAGEGAAPKAAQSPEAQQKSAQ